MITLGIFPESLLNQPNLEGFKEWFLTTYPYGAPDLVQLFLTLADHPNAIPWVETVLRGVPFLKCAIGYWIKLDDIPGRLDDPQRVAMRQVEQEALKPYKAAFDLRVDELQTSFSAQLKVLEAEYSTATQSYLDDYLKETKSQREAYETKWKVFQDEFVKAGIEPDPTHAHHYEMMLRDQMQLDPVVEAALFKYNTLIRPIFKEYRARTQQLQDDHDKKHKEAYAVFEPHYNRIREQSLDTYKSINALDSKIMVSRLKEIIGGLGLERITTNSKFKQDARDMFEA